MQLGHKCMDAIVKAKTWSPICAYVCAQIYHVNMILYPDRI